MKRFYNGFARLTRYCPALLAGAALFAVPAGSKADNWALIVGVSKYQSPNINSLRYPADDATAISTALTQQGHIPADHIKLLTDDQATRANIVGAVSGFLAQHVKAGDSVIISLAGHGVAKGVGLDAKSYFLCTDVRGVSKEAMDATAVDLRALCAEIGKLPAAQFILFVDACREDPTPGRGLKPNSQSDTFEASTRIVPPNGSQSSNSVTFYACQVGQRAYEDEAYKHGVFTYYILDAIQKAAGADLDGRIEMGHLASYVRTNVGNWASKSSADQTPELTFNDPDSAPADPIYFVKVAAASSAPFTLLPPALAIDTDPDTATVILNGAKVDKLPAQMKEGENVVRVEAAGYATVEKTFRALSGYEYRMIANLAKAGGAGASESALSVRLLEAQRAEERQDWDVAATGYRSLMSEKYPPAYERLASLQQRDTRKPSDQRSKDAIETLVKYNRETLPTPHSYNLLARAYSTYALKDAAQNPPKAEEDAPSDDVNVGGVKIPRNIFGGKRKKQEPRRIVDPDATGDFRVPENGAAAAGLARKAADEATKADALAVDSFLAQGFSLVAADRDGKNAPLSVGAFRSAVAASPNDAVANYGLGFGQYFFSAFVKDKAAREQQLQDAISPLDRAIELRPNYYEALRIRGFCHHLLGHGEQARKDYDSAIANRGSATDPDEVASLNVTQSVLLRQQAQDENGPRKAELMKASDGYMSDAKEIARDMKIALFLFSKIGLGRGIENFLDAPLRGLVPRNLGNFPIPRILR